VRVHHQRAYVLVNRPYSETSWIVEVFTREYGRLGLMAKGARRFKSRLKGSLMPFQPILVSWTGKGELPILTSAEIDQTDYNLVDHELRGDALVCGFYCNELIVNLLHRHDPHAALFDRYHSTIMALAEANSDELLPLVLRKFEQVVMKETGYQINFDFEADGKTSIEDHGIYRYQPAQGFVRLASLQRGAFYGRVIKSLNTQSSISLNNQEVSQGKQLMRDILSKTLGHKPIVSRELFYPKSR
jgi:DNA repair protein RecO (recombination protein O)